MLNLATYADKLPNVGEIIGYDGKWWEIVAMHLISESSGKWEAHAHIVEVSEECDIVGNDVVVVVLDRIDYIEP